MEAADRSYTTQGVADATGIPVTTILAWERRYGVPQPRRTAGGRRLYSSADVALLCALRDRTAQGTRAEVVARALQAGEDESRETPACVLLHLATEIHEVSCLYCGELSGELQTQRTAARALTRFVPAPGARPPARGPGGQPRCGRCGGGLYREPAERRSLPPFAPGPAVAVGQRSA
jgi:DNA-binding transcriptional MerR regulator